jgi:hypothetical protein
MAGGGRGDRADGPHPPRAHVRGVGHLLSARGLSSPHRRPGRGRVGQPPGRGSGTGDGERPVASPGAGHAGGNPVLAWPGCRRQRAFRAGDRPGPPAGQPAACGLGTELHVGDRGPARRPRNGRALPARGGRCRCPLPPGRLMGHRDRRPDIGQPAGRPRRADRGRGGRGRCAGTGPQPAGPHRDGRRAAVPGQDPCPWRAHSRGPGADRRGHRSHQPVPGPGDPDRPPGRNRTAGRPRRTGPGAARPWPRPAAGRPDRPRG